MIVDYSETPFKGHQGATYEESRPWWPAGSKPRVKRPNVLVVLLDDVGFASLGCYGGEIETPNIDRLAASGVRYTGFHTTSLCSPTRASLLTGRNHHSVGMSIVANADSSGYPSQTGSIRRDAGTLAEMLGSYGYRTYAVGKWHLAPAAEMSSVGPFDQWPLGRGFDRFYGFLDAATDQFYPELVRDNSRVKVPCPPEKGYTLTADLINNAIQMVEDQVSLDPDTPFFMYLAPGATHSPHQAPDEYLEKYRGRYDQGWDAVRESRLTRQKELGIVPEDTSLPPRNPGVPAWEDVPVEQQRLYSRFQEAYAAFLDHTDVEFGRLVAKLDEVGILQDTIILFMSDNGASQEGGDHGSINMAYYENVQVDSLEDNLHHIDDIGTKRVQNNYPLGWAMAANTPLKRYKQNTHEGGVRDPLIISWPSAVTDLGGIRTQFCHVIDIAPTILDVVGLPAPRELGGVKQMPLHGASLKDSLFGDVPSARLVQYFEMHGHRGIWMDGWKAVTFHQRDTRFSDDVWELYHVDEDFAELHDLAAEHPEMLRRLVDQWWVEAGKYGVLPLDDRRSVERRALTWKANPDLLPRSEVRLWGGINRIPCGAAPFALNRSYRIEAVVEASPEQDGVVVAHGGTSGGYAIYVLDGKLCHDYNYYGRIYHLEAPLPTDAPLEILGFEFEKTGDLSGRGHLLVEGIRVATVDMPATFQYFFDWGGLSVGRNPNAPVTPAYAAHGEFPYEGRVVKIDYTLGRDTPILSYLQED